MYNIGSIETLCASDVARDGKFKIFMLNFQWDSYKYETFPYYK
jgi:hypothetical protein